MDSFNLFINNLCKRVCIETGQKSEEILEHFYRVVFKPILDYKEFPIIVSDLYSKEELDKILENYNNVKEIPDYKKYFDYNALTFNTNLFNIYFSNFYNFNYEKSLLLIVEFLVKMQCII